MSEAFVTTDQLVDQDPAGFLSAVRDLEFDKNRRSAEPSHPEVISYTPDDDDTTQDLVPPGSITLFLAPRGSDFLAEVRAAYGAADAKAIARLAARAVEDMRGRQKLTFRQVARDLASGRPYGDLRYRGKTLAECVGLANDISFGVLPLTYVGGELDDSAFTFVQYVLDGSQADEMEVVLVKRAPHLSEAEQVVLDSKRLEINDVLEREEVFVGRGGQVAITVTTITIALFVVAVHTPTLTGGMDEFTLSDRFAKASRLAESRVKALGPAATIGDLIAARIDVMSRSF